MYLVGSWCLCSCRSDQKMLKWMCLLCQSICSDYRFWINPIYVPAFIQECLQIHRRQAEMVMATWGFDFCPLRRYSPFSTSLLKIVVSPAQLHLLPSSWCSHWTSPLLITIGSWLLSKVNFTLVRPFWVSLLIISQNSSDCFSWVSAFYLFYLLQIFCEREIFQRWWRQQLKAGIHVSYFLIWRGPGLSYSFPNSHSAVVFLSSQRQYPQPQNAEDMASALSTWLYSSPFFPYFWKFQLLPSPCDAHPIYWRLWAAEDLGRVPLCLSDDRDRRPSGIFEEFHYPASIWCQLHLAQLPLEQEVDVIVEDVEEIVCLLLPPAIFLWSIVFWADSAVPTQSLPLLFLPWLDPYMRSFSLSGRHVPQTPQQPFSSNTVTSSPRASPSSPSSPATASSCQVDPSTSTSVSLRPTAHLSVCYLPQSVAFLISASPHSSGHCLSGTWTAAAPSHRVSLVCSDCSSLSCWKMGRPESFRCCLMSSFNGSLLLSDYGWATPWNLFRTFSPSLDFDFEDNNKI